MGCERPGSFARPFVFDIVRAFPLQTPIPHSIGFGGYCGTFATVALDSSVNGARRAATQLASCFSRAPRSTPIASAAPFVVGAEARP